MHAALRPFLVRARADSIRADSLRILSRRDSLRLAAHADSADARIRAKVDSIRAADRARAGSAARADSASRAENTRSAFRSLSEEGNQNEPWIIEGQSLEGTKTGGTAIKLPVITQGVLKITAQDGQISADRDLATLLGNVRIVDTSRVVVAQHGIYQRSIRDLKLIESVHGTGREGTFDSNALDWDRLRDVMTLTGSAKVTQPDRVVWADRIVRDNLAHTVDANGHVRVLILPDSTWAWGDHSFYNEASARTILTGHPRMESPGVRGEAPTTVHADTLFLNENNQQGEASGRTRIVRGDMRTLSDRARFLTASDQILLYGNPVAWDPDGEIRADTIMVRIRARAADLLKAFGHVRVHYAPRDKPGEKNLVVGDTLTARLQSGVVTDMEVQGNAVSLYLPAPKEAEDGSGRNLAKARTIHIFLSRGEAEKVDLRTSATGIYVYPNDEDQRKLRNPGFRDSLGLPPARSKGGTAGKAPADTSRVAPGKAPPERSRVAAGKTPADTSRVATGKAPPDTSRVAAGKAPPDTSRVATGKAPPDGTRATARKALPDSTARAAVRPDSTRVPAAASRFVGPVLPVPAAGNATASPAAGDSVSESPPTPGAVEPLLDFLMKKGSLDVPDSLATRYDRIFTERVDYEGDTIRFYVPQNRIQILGKGKLTYRGSSLESEEINYQAVRHLVVATGKPKLSDAQSSVTGSKMTYRTDERDGIVYQGRTTMEGGYYYGDQIKRLSNEDLLVRSGDYTTCSHDSVPDYHFHADRMKLLPKDKVVARPVILYILNIPVLALPYYVFPVKHGRHSGVMLPDVEFGFGNQGRFARNLGYYWAMSDYMDLRTWIDYYDEGPRIYWNAIYNYKVRYLLNGGVNASYLREDETGGGTHIGWSVQGSHSQTLGEGAQLTAQANFTSDQNYRGQQDFAAPVDERLNRILQSSIQFTKSLSWAGLNVSGVRTQYLDATTAGGVQVSQQLPSVDFSVNSRPIGTAPDASGHGGRWSVLSSTYFGTSFAFRNTYTQNFGAAGTSNRAMQQNLNLTDNRSLGPFLRLRPSLAASWAAFGKDNLGHHNQAGAVWSASLSAGNTIYGNFLFPFGPIQGIRHVIEPSVTYNYSPEFRQLSYRDTLGNLQSRFPNVGGIGLSGSENSSMTFSLNQRFHFKWMSGGKVVKKENLLTWTTSSSYNFLARSPSRPLSDISNTFQLQPFSNLQSSASVTHDPYKRTPLDVSVNTNLRISSTMFGHHAGADTTGAGKGQGLQYGNFGDAGFQGADLGNRQSANPTPAPAQAGPPPWDLSLSHAWSFERGAEHPLNSLNASLSLSPTTNWQFSGSLYLDLVQRKVISHSIVLHRDLHCWEFRFEYRSSGGTSEYFFKIDIKQLPDVQYTRQGGSS